ncbi:MAG: tetraacyldisaccharide 4'-kinase [Deltaproteobacteria bacterium]|nr:tetraacyldisaccharide 4'-kinase [Deltaproteobacteria bacterium]
MDSGEAGDEPVLMAQNVPDVPVIVARDRSCGGRAAVERFDADVLILDDGFQHRQLARDIDIVLLDGRRPFGNGFMLPRGRMREPLRALRRADVVILTSTGEADAPPSEGIPQIPIFSGRRRPVDLVKGQAKDACPLDCLAGKRVCAFSGIARPDSFRRILEPLCGEVASFVPFPDHHVYTAGDVEYIRDAFRDSGAQVMLTTEKDGIKLTRFPDFFQDLYRLRIAMKIVPSKPEFEEYIITRLKK